MKRHMTNSSIKSKPRQRLILRYITESTVVIEKLSPVLRVMNPGLRSHHKLSLILTDRRPVSFAQLSRDVTCSFVFGCYKTQLNTYINYKLRISKLIYMDLQCIHRATAFTEWSFSSCDDECGVSESVTTLTAMCFLG